MVQVSDSVQNASRALTLVISQVSTSLFLSGVPSTLNPTQQSPFALSVVTPSGIPLSGTLTMSFQSNAVVASDDPVDQFSTGGRTISFSIPANGTTAVFPPGALILVGTVSGTLTFTASIQNGSGAIPVGTVTVLPVAPQMTNTTAVRSAAGLDIRVAGFSPERQVTGVQFVFDVITSGGIQRVTLKRDDAQSLFGTWYRDPSSTAFGSAFVFHQTFTVQGDATAIDAVTITLTNTQGATTGSAVKFTQQ
jgi:hypothetical protein